MYTYLAGPTVEIVKLCLCLLHRIPLQRLFCELSQVSTLDRKSRCCGDEKWGMSQMWSPLRGMFWALLEITLVCLTPSAFGEAPTPTDWPPLFHALLYQNYSGTLGLMDLYYDWENGRNLHVIKIQLEPVLHDMEYQNGTVLKWEVGAKCGHFDARVGLLPPNWLKGATYQGTEKVDGFSVNVWTKADFITYREDVVSKKPVSWTFYTGRDVHVILFQPGFILAEEEWNVPVDCFPDDEEVLSSASNMHRPNNPLSDIREWISKSVSA